MHAQRAPRILMKWLTSPSNTWRAGQRLTVCAGVAIRVCCSLSQPGRQLDLSVKQWLQLLADPPQPLAQERLLAAEPDSHMTLESHVRAGDDERALVHAHAVGDL